jgi:hypothetical protein
VIEAIFSFIAYIISVITLVTVLTLLMDIAEWNDNNKRKWIVIFLIIPYATMLFEYWMA